MATHPPVDPRVTVRGLWKLFGNRPPTEVTPDIRDKTKAELREAHGLVLALRDVSFDVAPGETFVVMGLSGSGKSTLVRSLIRLIEPTFGEIRVDGEDILRYDENELIEFRRKKAAMVFQHFGLLPHRTVEENAAWGLEVQGIEKIARTERAREVLELVGLKGWEEYRPSTLSGGMQQRVGLARAIAANPSLLLMDEPFSGLDPLIRRDMQNELIRLQQQLHKTIMFITHDLNEALKLGDHIAIMRDGAVIQVGTGEEILANPADDYVTEFVRDVRKSSVITVRTLMQRPVVPVLSTMSPREAMDAIGGQGEVAGFVADRRGLYIGAVSFAHLAEASQRGDETVVSALSDDVRPVPADLSVSAALPLVRNVSGPVPLIDEDGRLVGQVLASALIELMEQESIEAAAVAEAEAAVAIGTDRG